MEDIFSCGLFRINDLKTKDVIQKLESENAELKKDRERLEFLFKHIASVEVMSQNEYCVINCYNEELSDYCGSQREAIDNAMTKLKGGKR